PVTPPLPPAPGPVAALPRRPGPRSAASWAAGPGSCAGTARARARRPSPRRDFVGPLQPIADFHPVKAGEHGVGLGIARVHQQRTPAELGHFAGRRDDDDVLFADALHDPAADLLIAPAQQIPLAAHRRDD